MHDYSAARLYNSYLISTDNINTAISETYKFLRENIFCDDQLSDTDDIEQYSHPDLLICSKEDVTAKNITVDQIRKLREFIYKSSVISGYKVGIIVSADLMNENAANSCLKMLEDTPKKSLIILLTSLPAALIPTIRSRCSKISYHSGNTKGSDNEDYNKFLKIFAEKDRVEGKNSLIREFAGKDRSRWLSFAIKLEQLFGKLVKLRSGLEVDLTAYEREIYSRFDILSYEQLEYESKQMSELIRDVVEYDLDLKAATILLLGYFNNPGSNLE